MKIKDILKKLGIIKKEHVPIEPYRGGNMYDLFVKKTIDKRLERKNTAVIDDDKINWNSTYEGPKIRRFTIPVNGLSREEAEDQIKKLMSEYHEDVEWKNDYKLPEVKRVYSDLDPYGEENWNDDIHSFDKDYWFPTKRQKSLIEQAKIMYSKNNAAIYKKFVIPIPNWNAVLE